MIWQVLDVRAVWIKEMASALSRQVPTLGWLPKFCSAAILQNEQEEELTCNDPPLLIRSFPLQRGFARFPLSAIAREHKRMVRRLRERGNGPLVCTAPHYALVAERWPGPVVYYVTDMFAAYRQEPGFIRSLDRKMCKAATLVCPNSQRIADYLLREAQCPEEKLTIIPNATRSANLLDELSLRAGELPADTADLPRPIAGVIGNLAENTDWVLLRKTVDRTPWLSWVLVGPIEMPVVDPEQNHERQQLMTQGGRVRFVGPKPYGELQRYARSFDVAILPYRKKEPTYSGSSTRFYEQLAAGRPIIATKGVEELLHKEPLLRLEDSAEEMIAALEELRDLEFRDGYEEMRRQASQSETWDARALKLVGALSEVGMRDIEAA